MGTGEERVNQRWESTAEKGVGVDRDMSEDALMEWQRGRWRLLLKAEDRWRWWAGVAAVGEDGVGKAQCALSTLRNMLRSEKQSV